MTQLRVTERGHGLDEWISDLRSMEREDGTLKERLDAVTEVFCEGLRAAMPVRTGALKASGSWSSRLTGEVYEAEVTFGGPLAPYAPYVIGRHVDGEHPWDEVQPRIEPLYEAVIAQEFTA